MIKTKAGSWRLLGAILFLLAACGKKDDAAPTPNLSDPGMENKPSAQAEVKASSGPIELSFLVYKKELKPGDSLWQQIRIKNVGDKELIVSDPIFTDPRELRRQSRSAYGIYLEAVSPDGKPLQVQFNPAADQGSDIAEGVSGLLEVTGPEEKAMVDKWKKQGLSLREINMKLLEFNTKKLGAVENSGRTVVKLSPGQSTGTKASYFYSLTDKTQNKPRPSPIGEFAQIDFFEFTTAGKYRIRAVYDQAPTDKSRELSRRLALPTYPEEVQFHTPWIQVEVLP